MSTRRTRSIAPNANAAIYCRISRDKRGEGLGVERQEAACRKLAASLGVTVTSDPYVDNDISAYSGKKRPHYLQLLRDIDAGIVSVVLAWHPDRLHRSPIELEDYINVSEKRGVATHTVQAGLWDLSTPSGRMVARQLGAVARYESENRSERVKLAAEQRAARGGWSGGRRCYGWEPDGKTPREIEAVELRNAAEQVAEGVSLRAVVADMNKRGVPTTCGKRWASVTLRDALIAPRQAGLSAHHGEIMGEAEWPAIIPVDQWQAVNRILTDPTRKTNYVGGTVKWLGSGLYRCGVCGMPEVRARVTSHHGQTRKRYRCMNRIKGQPETHVGRDAVMLDRYVEATVVERLSNPKVLRRMRKYLDQGHVDAPALRLEMTDKRKRLTQAAQMFTGGDIDRAQLATITAGARARIEAIESELAHAGTQSPLKHFASNDDIAVVWFGPDGPQGDRTGGLPLGVRRELLRLLCDVVILPAPFGPAVDGRGFKPECVDMVWRGPAK